MPSVISKITYSLLNKHIHKCASWSSKHCSERRVIIIATLLVLAPMSHSSPGGGGLLSQSYEKACVLGREPSVCGERVLHLECGGSLSLLLHLVWQYYEMPLSSFRAVPFCKTFCGHPGSESYWRTGSWAFGRQHTLHKEGVTSDMSSGKITAAKGMG